MKKRNPLSFTHLAVSCFFIFFLALLLHSEKHVEYPNADTILTIVTNKDYGSILPT